MREIALRRSAKLLHMHEPFEYYMSNIVFLPQKRFVKKIIKSHLEGFFGQQLIIKRQKLTNIASFDKLSQIQYHLDSLGHKTVPQGQLEIRDQIILLLLAYLHPYAYKARIE